MIAATNRQNLDASQKEVEARVGIEPAYTDLQDARRQNDDDPV